MKDTVRKTKMAGLMRHSDVRSPERTGVPGNAGAWVKSAFCFIDSVPYKIEYTQKGIKLWVIN